MSGLSKVLYPGSFDPLHNGHIEIVEIDEKLVSRDAANIEFKTNLLRARSKIGDILLALTGDLLEKRLTEVSRVAPSFAAAQSPSSVGQPGGCFPTILVLTSLRVEIPRRVALQCGAI